MAEKVIGAVDLGASGGKMFLGFFEGGCFKMEEVHRFPNESVDVYSYEPEGRKVVQKTYWNDLGILSNIIISLRQVSARGIKKIDSLAIDTWGTDGVIFNKYGEPEDRLYNYRDHRLDDIRNELFSKIPERELFFLTGIPSLQFNQVNQLFWLLKKRPEYLKAAKFFLPVSSLFYYYLGGYRFAEYTWASTTQLLDPCTKRWNKEVFERLDMPLSIMPEILMPGAALGPVFPDVLKETSLAGCELAATASHDTAAAYYAAPVADETASLIISSGTWSLVGKLVPEPVISDFSFEKNFTNEGGVGNIRFLKNVMGTWLIQELKKNWEEEDNREFSWEEIVRLAEAGDEFFSFIDPDHASFFNPRSMESAVKSFCRETGQKIPRTRETILRMCYESLALKCMLVNSDIEEASGKRNDRIYVVGGGSKNALLNSFIAEASGLPVYAGPVEATAAGNILVQARSMGLTSSDEVSRRLIRKSFEITEFKPENSRAWKQKADIFRNIIQKSRLSI